MTDPLDELLELRPTEASALLIDPVGLAVRAERSARHARRRANALTGVLGVAALTVVAAVGVMFLPPTQAVPAASPTPEFPHPSSTPMSSFAPMHAGDEAAAYSAPRLAYGQLIGNGKPERMCLSNFRSFYVSTCAATVPVTGLTWSQLPWRVTNTNGGTTADAVVWGYFDGTSFRATAVSRGQDTNVSLSMPTPSPAPASTALIACARTLTNSTTTGSGTELKLSVAYEAGLDAYWMDAGSHRLMVATSKGIDAAAVKVRTFWNGPACIGSVPKQGPLVELLAAQKRVHDAKIEGVISVAPAVEDGGVLQVNVVANIPGLRERVVAVAGKSVPLTIVPVIVTVH